MTKSTLDLVERLPERRRADWEHLGNRIEGDVVVEDAEASLGDRPRHGQLPYSGWAVKEDEPRAGIAHGRTS